ncbi:lipoprotein LprJ [Mycobacterium tuberculosis]|nr:lipoprotein LprJ [Mycobacterium tuberculosis]
MTAHTHDGTRTWRTGRQATTLLALLAGVFGGAASCAAPIQADMMGNAFLTALTNAGIAYDQPATTVALGRSVCPMVVAPGGTFESITSRMAEINGMSRDMASTFTIVAAGARADLGQLEQALTVLSTPQLDPGRTGSTAARLFYAYAEILLALGRGDEALQWFLRSAAADIDGVTDAEDRVDELGAREQK